MSRFRRLYIALGLVVVVMLALNVVNIPRGTSLDCFKSTTTYKTRPASYGFPFVIVRSNPNADGCVTTTHYASYSTYQSNPAAALYDISLALLVLTVVYIAGMRLEARRVHAIRMQKESR